ncbi:MAG: FISUMP domain-containing protein [Bacteroidales bacterium]|nr:FISUMP domain-containing protein [Bacteroidales bacterium]
MDLTNKTINGFTLLRKLGEGGMAEVWYAENNIEKPAAVKILHKDLSLNDEIVARFRNEARIMVKLNHTNIRQVYDFATIENRPCIIMEYLEGKDLKHMLKEGAQFSDAQLQQWWNQMADALNYTHSENIIHRDIKPSNIFITAKGQLKLLDFGIAKIRDSITMTQTGTHMGTLMYMSPEQVKDSKHLTYKTDIYSLAVTFYHLLTGKAPYDNTNSSFYEIQKKIVEDPIHISEIPQIWQEFIEPYVSKNPEYRPSLSHFRIKEPGIETKTDATENTIIDHPILPPQPQPQPQPSPQHQPKPSKRKIFLIPGIALLLLVVLFIWRPWSGPGAEELAAIEQTRLDSIAADSIARVFAATSQATSPATTASKATVITGTASNIQQTTAVVTGNVTSDGGARVFERGICYSTSRNPSTNNSKASADSGTGSFTANLTGLNIYTTYYMHAYAINEKGTAYGEERSFTTRGGAFTDSRDGKTYKWVKIGTQTWMAENLNFSTGTSWCYENNTSNCSKYGRLYDWNTAKSACPSGWHLPSKSDYETLLISVGGSGGSEIREYNAYHALKVGGNSGFSALLGGSYDVHLSIFSEIGEIGYWWSSSKDQEFDLEAAPCYLQLYKRDRDAYMSFLWSNLKGFSVRCVRDF